MSIPSTCLIEEPNPAESWSVIESWISNRDPSSIFRGQSDASWHLRTNLERALEQAGRPLTQASGIELALLRKFQREAHQHLAHLPAEDNILDWLALMQHHGAPTRLLDWSHSAYAALFFAVVDQHPDKESALIAIDWGWIDQQLPAAAKSLLNDGDRNLRSAGAFFNFFKEVMGIAKLNSHTQTQRQTQQQGTFLVPADPALPFEDNLIVSLLRSSTPRLFKLRISPAIRNKVLRELHRRNMNAANLFPGLDGYARSCQSYLAVENLIDYGPLT